MPLFCHRLCMDHKSKKNTYFLEYLKWLASHVSGQSVATCCFFAAAKNFDSFQNDQIFTRYQRAKAETWQPPQGSELKITNQQDQKKRNPRVGYLVSILTRSKASNSSVWETDRRSESSTCWAALADGAERASSGWQHLCTSVIPVIWNH